MITETFTVTGMTCGHCVQAVSGELQALEGVEQVTVDLPTGAVTVVSATGVDRASVAAAVDEAGYELTS